VFVPEAGKRTDAIWRKLRDVFKERKLLLPNFTSDKPEAILAAMEQSFKSAPDRKVLVMFDEADSFLDADAADNFHQVTMFRRLMDVTGRRFKVIFAGLHNVQRFQGIPNQPLAHFGRAILVGPLEPQAAQKLIREPLEVLGYSFASERGILTILSYTNYHPGLIQLFCYELLRTLQNQWTGATPPYKIEQKDLESVYRKIRTEIRDRFNWTLALDTHYEVIALSMIAEQENDKNFGECFPPERILDSLKNCWWPKGFSDVTLDRFRGWLDEMCGLGVLVRDLNGRYSIRSPNVVRLL